MSLLLKNPHKLSVVSPQSITLNNPKILNPGPKISCPLSQLTWANTCRISKICRCKILGFRIFSLWIWLQCNFKEIMEILISRRRGLGTKLETCKICRIWWVNSLWTLIILDSSNNHNSRHRTSIIRTICSNTRNSCNNTSNFPSNRDRPPNNSKLWCKIIISNNLNSNKLILWINNKTLIIIIICKPCKIIINNFRVNKEVSKGHKDRRLSRAKWWQLLISWVNQRLPTLVNRLRLYSWRVQATTLSQGDLMKH